MVASVCFQAVSRFVEEAEEGVIIFSMGISLGVNMPCRVFRKLLAAFSRGAIQ